MGNCLPFIMQCLQQQPPAAQTPSNAAHVSINCACFHSNIGDDDDDEEAAEATNEHYYSAS